MRENVGCRFGGLGGAARMRFEAWSVLALGSCLRLRSWGVRVLERCI